MDTSKYKKLTQLEHVLLRPDMYVGNVNRINSECWTVGPDSSRAELKTIEYCPALLKICDELICNAIDESRRDESLDLIEIDVGDGAFAVANNGRGIPAILHSEHGVHVPELIFGHFMSGSNFDDAEARNGAGKNGLGCKLANAFSSRFSVDVQDPVAGIKYAQTWTNNMTNVEKPKISRPKKPPVRGHVRVRLLPSFDRVGGGAQGFDEDFMGLIRRRAFDVAACTPSRVKVKMNGRIVPCKEFGDYVDLFVGGKKDCPRVSDVLLDGRFKICVVPSGDGCFRHVSFVNGACTPGGGSHVDVVVGQLVRKISDAVSVKAKGTTIKPQIVKDKIWLFVDAIIPNPEFSSQTKEQCTSKWSSFGGKVEVGEDAIQKIVNKLGIAEDIVRESKEKESRALGRATDGRKSADVRGIKGLEDAVRAGTRDSAKACLILTEGDSARAFAIAGLGVIGREYFGVMALKGKILNTREASAKQISDNVEISNVKKILGLQHGTKYESVSQLRYGSVLMLTDADLDGTHICALFLNFMHHMWPELLAMNYVSVMRTPVIKAFRGADALTFFHEAEYDEWRKRNGGTTGYRLKYYKGLGTSTSSESKAYFTELKNLRTRFAWSGKGSSEAIELAFKKDRAKDRKRWILDAVKSETVPLPRSPEIRIEDFINRELVQFSVYDVQRSIPSVIDGLKISQRKIMFACLFPPLKEEMKVAQLASKAATRTLYRHGEQSLATAIVNMAQDFVGSGNNLNLLSPNGNFGTRLQGGADAASPRYIYTKITARCEKLFREEDASLLESLEEEGESVEPRHFFPVLPLVLVNGTLGIGSGFSTFVPSHSLEDVAANVIRWIENRPLEPMIPSYAGFSGTITPSLGGGPKCFEAAGKMARISPGKVEITELPVGMWTDSFKEVLDKNEERFWNHSTEDSVKFVVEFDGTDLEAEKRFGLRKKLSTSNMHLLDVRGGVKKYESAQEIIEDFCAYRLRVYERRKETRLRCIRDGRDAARRKAAFIDAVCSGKVQIVGRKEKDIAADLRAAGVPPTGDGTWKGYLDMKVSTLTRERVDALKKEISGLERSEKVLEDTDVRDIWKAEISELLRCS